MNAEQSMPDQPVIALTTTPADIAQVLARTLVERGVAACVNIIPTVHSVYSWQGNVDESTEALLVIKTTAGAVEALNGHLQELHPYQVYELITLPITAGNPAYLGWLVESVRP